MPAGLNPLPPKPGSTCPPVDARLVSRTMGGQSFEAELLLRQIAQGDRRAFRDLYDLAAGRMLAAARRILGDQALAEDAVQDAFLRVWRSAARFDPARGAALAWIGRIVRNAAFDRLPREQERDPERIEDIEIAVMPVEPPDARIGQCIKRLPELQGKAIVLMYVHGLTHSELAVRLEAPLGTVKSWIRRGSEALRECLGVPA